MSTETQGKTEKSIINQETNQTQPITLVSPKAGDKSNTANNISKP